MSFQIIRQASPDYPAFLPSTLRWAIAMFRWLLVFVSLYPVASLADEFYTLVNFNCDEHADQLVVTHTGAYNEEGQALVANKGKYSWSPSELRGLPNNDKQFQLPKTIARSCRLSDGLYIFRLKPVPENFKNITGRCGDWETASIVILRNKHELVNVQLDQSCYDWNAPVITAIQVRAGAGKPIMSTKTPNEFFK